MHEFAAGADGLLLRDAALEAGKIALGYFRSDNRAWTKHGDSPVSEADIEVDQFLRRELLAARPDTGWLSEETTDNPDRLERDTVFVVDPIDGTRGFLGGDPNWCISIALVSKGRPISAVLHCPALDRTFVARADHGSWLNGKSMRAEGGDTVRTLTGSRRINDAIEKAFPGRFRILSFLPSLAYRMALVASGELDGAYARRGSHEWDVAAADLIISENGGRVTASGGEELRYNTADIRMPPLIAARANLHEQVTNIAKSGGFLH